MEFLDIEGIVDLKKDSLDERFCRVIQALQNIEFLDGGYISLEINDDLSIRASGEISDGYGVSRLLSQLSGYLAEESFILINRVAWELRVRLTRPESVVRLELAHPDSQLRSA